EQGAKLVGQLDCFLAALGLADHGESGCGRNHRGGCTTERCLIVDDQDRHVRHVGPTPRRRPGPVGWVTPGCRPALRHIGSVAAGRENRLAALAPARLHFVPRPRPRSIPGHTAIFPSPYWLWQGATTTLPGYAPGWTRQAHRSRLERERAEGEWSG